MAIKKTLGAKLIPAFGWGMNSLFFLILPGWSLWLLIFGKFGTDFLSQIYYYTLIVGLSGGFWILGLKLWEVWDNRFVLHQRAKWSSLHVNRKVFYRVCIPPDFNNSLMDMFGFFSDMSTIAGGERQKYEIYNEGKWYYNFAFDVVIEGGEIKIYMSFPYKRIDLVKKIFKARFPRIKLVECDDIYKGLPKNWENNKGIWGYNNFYAADYTLAEKGLWPLGHPTDFASWSNGNPLTELYNSLREFDPNIRIILQYIYRPFPNVYYEEWSKILQEEKSKILAQNTSFRKKSGEEATTGDLVTQKQKDVFINAENALGQVHMRTHLRLVVFLPDDKPFYNSIVDKMMKSFFGQTSGDNNIIVKNWFTATDRYFFSSNLPLPDTWLAPIANRFYHSKEIEYRRKIHWIGLLSRDVDISNNSMDMFMDAFSLATTFHFPVGIGVFPEHFDTGSESNVQKQDQIEKEPKIIQDWSTIQYNNNQSEPNSVNPKEDFEILGLPNITPPTEFERTNYPNTTPTNFPPVSSSISLNQLRYKTVHSNLDPQPPKTRFEKK